MHNKGGADRAGGGVNVLQSKTNKHINGHLKAQDRGTEKRWGFKTSGTKTNERESEQMKSERAQNELNENERALKRTNSFLYYFLHFLFL